MNINFNQNKNETHKYNKSFGSNKFDINIYSEMQILILSGNNLKGENAVKVERTKVEEEKIAKASERVHEHNPRCPKCGRL